MKAENIQLTKNQIQLLDIIQSFRYLPLKILTKIAQDQGLYTFRQNISPVLKKFEDGGIINSFRYGNNAKVVYITRSGAKRLGFELGIPVSELFIPNQGKKVSFAMLEHTIKIAELYGEYVKEQRNYPQVFLEKWEGDQRIRCQYSFKSNRTQKKVRRNLIPDSYFQLSKQDEKYGYFIEYDTGSMDRDQLAFKFMRYFEYFHYGNWQKRFLTYPSVIFITERLEELFLRLITKPEITLDQALRNRSLFSSSKNILWRGIGKVENLRSINSQSIRDFLNLNFIFTINNQTWAKQLLENLE